MSVREVLHHKRKVVDVGVHSQESHIRHGGKLGVEKRVSAQGNQTEGYTERRLTVP